MTLNYNVKFMHETSTCFHSCLFIQCLLLKETRTPAVYIGYVHGMANVASQILFTNYLVPKSAIINLAN